MKSVVSQLLYLVRQGELRGNLARLLKLLIVLGVLIIVFAEAFLPLTPTGELLMLGTDQPRRDFDRTFGCPRPHHAAAGSATAGACAATM